MTLALIQPIELTTKRLWVPVVPCGRCGQRMPADHRHHINEAAPVAAETASDTERKHTS